MKNVALRLTALVFGMLLIGCLHKSSPPKSNVTVPTLQVPAKFSTDMLKIIRKPNEAVNVVGVRLADDRAPASDFLIDVENMTSRNVTDVWYFLAPFENCPAADGIGKRMISNVYPDTLASPSKRFLRPHETLTLKIPRDTYEAILQAQVKWNCPVPFTTELQLRGVGYVGQPVLE